MKSWYQIRAQAEGEAEILLYGEIGFFGVLAIDLIKEIRALGSPKKLMVRVNSPGGQWVQGLALYNFFARYPGEVTFVIDGIAASIASVIVMAGKVIMPENTFLMIHDIIGFADGTPDEIREQADIFDKLKLSMVQAYTAKSKLSEDKILEMMATETWLSAQEAKDLGLADEISLAIQLAALVNPEEFKHLPAALKAATPESTSDAPPTVTKTVTLGDRSITTTEPADLEKIRNDAATQAIEEANRRAQDILTLCAQAGVPDVASEYLNRGMTAEQVKGRLADADKIRAACAAARLPDRAQGYIRAGMTEVEARADLFDVLKARDPIELDNKHTEAIRIETKPVINASEIYVSRKPKSLDSRR